MASATVSDNHDTSRSHIIGGAAAAELIWLDHPDARTISDPRTPTFADAVIDGLGRLLASMPGAIAEVVSGAASAAEDLNVDRFQGLIEIIQNADDIGATEVRFAVRQMEDRFQLLVVHNGQPVICRNVLAMALPFLTTKRDDPRQKGRFGIGLNTLARISSGVSIHSNPYHFSVGKLTIRRVAPESSVDRFYKPSSDTLIVLDLLPGFQEDELGRWFDNWEADGLLFLSSVCSFRRCNISGQTLGHKKVSATAWESTIFVGQPGQTKQVRRRTVRTNSITWMAFCTDVPIPSELERSHKAKSDSTTFSIALPEKPAKTGLFVSFRTRVPTGLTVSIDAQFDPSTSREELLDNPWNSWLIDRVADLVADVACNLLASEPKSAWQIIPLAAEKVGNTADRWPRVAFDRAFHRIRNAIGERALLRVDGQLISLNTTAYEDETFSGLLDAKDTELLAPSRKAVSIGALDDAGRWRKVLDEIGVSQVVGVFDVLVGFGDSVFGDKPPEWWAMAADRLTTSHPRRVFNCPLWLTVHRRAVSCKRVGTGPPLVFGPSLSAFAEKWTLFDRLHEVYGQTPEGKRALDWLMRSAAFSAAPDAETELAAFADTFRAVPVAISDGDLRDLRDRFDVVTERSAEDLGRRVGSALLLDGFTFEHGEKENKKVSPIRAYLPRALEGEHPYWAEAAETVTGIDWVSPSYQEKLRTGATPSKGKLGPARRGPRKFLLLLGVEGAPRLVKLETQYAGPLRQTELREHGAGYVEYDWHSPDLTRVLNSLPSLSRKQRQLQSPALLKTLSRHWARVYTSNTSVPALWHARKYTYKKGLVGAAWLCKLRETEWMAVRNGELVTPDRAVIRSAQTETLYSNDLFVCNVKEADVRPELASELKLITAVRASDLVSHLEQIRDKSLEIEHRRIMQAYEALANLCRDYPYGQIGDMRPWELQRHFSDGKGLISLRPGEWKLPKEVFSGKDIFHQPELFVPSEATYAKLWRALDVQIPGLIDCINYCRRLADRSYNLESEAILIEVYRHMDPLLPHATRLHKEQLLSLPLCCSGKWVRVRPIYYVEDRELRACLHRVLADHYFWTPPCDFAELPQLAASLNLIQLDPVLTVRENREEARELGESLKSGFQRSVDQLSNDLARNDVSTREGLAIPWDELRDIPLFVYEEAFQVEVRETHLGDAVIKVKMKALLSQNPLELHVSVDGLQERENCGRALALLFPPQARWKIENAWVASWIASQESQNIEAMRFASDKEHAQKLTELAQSVQCAKTPQIRTLSRADLTPEVKPRVLKSFRGRVTQVSVHKGSPPVLSSEPEPRALVELGPGCVSDQGCSSSTDTGGLQLSSTRTAGLGDTDPNPYFVH